MNPYEYQQGEYLDIVLSGEPTRLHPGNTHVFSHTLQSEGDHIYVIHREMPDESIEASYLWRLGFVEQGRVEKYNDLVGRLGNIGCELHVAPFMTDHDMQRFQNSFGRLAVVDSVEHQLTSRHEQQIAGWRRTLKKMPTKDIHEEFALPQPPQRLPRRWA